MKSISIKINAMNEKQCMKTVGVLWFLLMVMCISGCNDDDDVTSIDDAGELVLVTSIPTDGAGNRGYFAQKTSLENNGLVDNSNATELLASGIGAVTPYRDNIYFTNFNQLRIEKWSFNESNVAVEEGSVSVLELVFPGNPVIADDNTAFVGGGSTEIVIFNPTTMQRTGKIDFSSFSIVGTVTDFPASGAEVVVEAIPEIIVRDNILYAALMPMSDFSTFTPAVTDCPILVVDLDEVDPNSSDNSDAIIKRISDERGSATGAWATGGGAGFMKLDENNDIYVLSHNGWTLFRQIIGQPASLLRIPNGSTDFDPDFYFDLESAAAGNGTPVTNFEYYGNGRFMASVLDFSQINPDNPGSQFLDPVYQWWSFDITTQSAQRVSEDYTVAGVVALSYFKDGIGYLPLQDNTESFILRVDLNTLESSRLFATAGAPQLIELQE